MRVSYNPFRMATELKVIQTEFGNINTKTLNYFSHRKQEHFFIKYQGFGISVTEVDLCKKYGVKNIVLKYKGKNKNTLYKIKLDYLKYMERYTNEEDGKCDEQYILPIKEMEIIGEEVC
jgi:hypothetical protein